MKLTVEFICTGVEYGTETPVQIARVADEGEQNVMLLARHQEGDWFVTWVGPKDHSVRIPVGFARPEQHILDRLEEVAELW